MGNTNIKSRGNRMGNDFVGYKLKMSDRESQRIEAFGRERLYSTLYKKCE